MEELLLCGEAVEAVVGDGESLFCPKQSAGRGSSAAPAAGAVGEQGAASAWGVDPRRSASM